MSDLVLSPFLRRGKTISVVKRLRHIALGKRFGRLVVIEDLPHQYRKPRRVVCTCDCGNRWEGPFSNLRTGVTKSCGCLKHELTHARFFKGVGRLTYTYYNRVKKRALQRGIPFEVTIESLWGLYLQQEGRCALSGKSIEFYPASTSRTSASLDRINSSLGYVEGNVQWVDKWLNKMKLHWSTDDFVSLCREVVLYHDRRP